MEYVNQDQKNVGMDNIEKMRAHIMEKLPNCGACLIEVDVGVKPSAITIKIFPAFKNDNLSKILYSGWKTSFENNAEQILCNLQIAHSCHFRYRIMWPVKVDG